MPEHDPRPSEWRGALGAAEYRATRPRLSDEPIVQTMALTDEQHRRWLDDDAVADWWQDANRIDNWQVGTTERPWLIEDTQRLTEKLAEAVQGAML